MFLNLNLTQIRNYVDLMKFLKKLITTTWGADNVTFVSAYPKTQETSNFITPIITYKVQSKLPGEFGSTKEIKPRFRDYVKVSETNLPIEGDTVEAWGQMFDYYIEFEIWAENGEEADDVAARFQSFIAQFTGYLQKLGVSQIFFENMTSDTSTGRWRTDLINRTITYRIRIDEILTVKIPMIDGIGIETWAHDDTFNMILEIFLREHPEYAEGIDEPVEPK